MKLFLKYLFLNKVLEKFNKEKFVILYFVFFVNEWFYLFKNSSSFLFFIK